MLKVIFTGPTLNYNDLKRCALKSEVININQIEELSYIDIEDSQSIIAIAPPIAEGDIMKCLAFNPSVIAIVDGYFENTTSIWHKEILYALKKNINILGAASMGALRAVELDSFGMMGIGQIYNDFKSGNLSDDDEVTVAHAPNTLNYANISIAMVNIRATLEKAYRENVINALYKDKILFKLKSTFYKKRRYECIRDAEWIRNNQLNPEVIIKFLDWVKHNHIDQKRNDALLLVQYVDEFIDPDKIEKKIFHFEDTTIWRKNLTSL